VSYGAVLGSLYLLRVQEGVVPLGPVRANLMEGLRYVTRSPVILALVLLVAVVSLLGRSYGQLMPVFARDILALDAAGMSGMYAAAGLGSVVGATVLILLQNPRKKGWIALGGGLGFAVALTFFSLSRSLPWSLVLLFCMGFLLITFSTTVSTLLQREAPEHLRGRVMSVYILAWQGLEYLGVMVIATLADLWTAPLAVLAAAATVGLVVVGVAAVRTEIMQLE
jgi:predicted MFS family arabinose efflux permease